MINVYIGFVSGLGCIQLMIRTIHCPLSSTNRIDSLSGIPFMIYLMNRFYKFLYFSFLLTQFPITLMVFFTTQFNASRVLRQPTNLSLRYFHVDASGSK